MPSVGQKWCWRCKTTEGFLGVASKSKKKDGTYWCSYVCRPCNTEYYRERNRKKGPEYMREIAKATYQKHKEKWLARAKVRYAVKVGKLEKPKGCEFCGHEKPLHGHHDDYSKPLDVRWLCASCHADTHIEMGNGYGRITAD